MVLKIVGTVTSVHERNGNRVVITFKGGVAGGTNTKETLKIDINNITQHINKSSIKMAGSDGTAGEYTIFFNDNEFLIVNDAVLLDMQPKILPKQKGPAAARKSIEEKHQKLFDLLRNKDIFLSLNPKAEGPLCSDTMNFTHIEIVIHE
jgi:hypothetical protein